MDSKELFNEYKMSYKDLIVYLIKKYGKAEYDYYTDLSCTIKNRNVSRISEGLFCHHIDEDKGNNLGEPRWAQKQPFEWQKKDRLVYCNLLEHLLLHIKISIMRSRQNQVAPLPGVYFLSNHLNDIYMSGGKIQRWGFKCSELVEDNYSDYIRIICIFLAYIEENYEGAEEELLEHINMILPEICGGANNASAYNQIHKDICEYELNKEDSEVLEELSCCKLYDSRFAVIDVETTFSGETMSIGVVIAKKNTFEIVDDRYYVIEPACNHRAMYRRQLYLPEARIYLKSSRKKVIEDLQNYLQKNGIKRIFAYNGGFDRNCLPELAKYSWYDIVRIAAYKQYNPKIPKDAECHSTGRMKRGYRVEEMMFILTGDDLYRESHNAYFDAIDELEIMRLLGRRIDAYSVALL